MRIEVGGQLRRAVADTLLVGVIIAAIALTGSQAHAQCLGFACGFAGGFADSSQLRMQREQMEMQRQQMELETFQTQLAIVQHTKNQTSKMTLARAYCNNHADLFSDDPPTPIGAFWWKLAHHDQGLAICMTEFGLK